MIVPSPCSTIVHTGASSVAVAGSTSWNYTAWPFLSPAPRKLEFLMIAAGTHRGCFDKVVEIRR
jgi:hypothetical protein